MYQPFAISFRQAGERAGARRLAQRFVLAVSLFGLALAPTLAQSKDSDEGSVTIYTPSGGIIHQQITDQAMLDTLSKNAMAIPDGGAIVMRGGKWYLVSNHKMPDGTMLLDAMTKK